MQSSNKLNYKNSLLMFRRVMALGSLHCGKVSPDISDSIDKIFLILMNYCKILLYL